MLFYSTVRKSSPVSFRTAVLEGMPEDGGLYMPETTPLLSPELLSRFGSASLQEISVEVVRPFVGKEISDNQLSDLMNNALNFEAPLVRLEERLYVLELFHGPTLAFKDFGARFLARMMSYLIRDSDRDLIVLVATSGDTGSAVANGFYNVAGVKVVLLYPSKMVSSIQEKQLTALGGNIFALEIAGNFDDCQRLVKHAFSDVDLRQLKSVTSANSINIARWIPQSFYYFYASKRLPNGEDRPFFSVPSGNFGNLTAGLLAKKMGAPIGRFIAASNVNDVIPRFLENGKFIPRDAVSTLSNAMDVGNPSNFARLMALYDNDLDAIRQDVIGISISDDRTREGMEEVFRKFSYVLDPHSAIGYLGAKQYLERNAEEGAAVFLATAHPAKFPEIVEEVTGQSIEPPESLKSALSRPKQSLLMRNNYEDLKSFLLSL